MPPGTGHRQVGEVVVDVEERGAGDMAGEVQLPAPGGVAELPAAVDELVSHGSTIAPGDCAPTSVGSTTHRGMRRRIWVAVGILLAFVGIAASAGGAYAYFWDASRADVI